MIFKVSPLLPTEVHSNRQSPLKVLLVRVPRSIRANTHTNRMYILMFLSIVVNRIWNSNGPGYTPNFNCMAKFKLSNRSIQWLQIKRFQRKLFILWWQLTL